MEIAVDLTPIPKQITGVGEYARCLLKSLTEFDRENHYWLFIKEDQCEQYNPGRENFHIVPQSRILHNRMIRLLWEQTALPLHLLRRKIELLHSIHYTTPWIAPCKRVITFHDMTFYLFPEKHTWIKRLFFQSIIPVSIKKANHIFADSKNTKADIIKILDISPAKIDVVYLAADSNYRPFNIESLDLNLKKKYGIRFPYILYVGTLEPRKNVSRLIQAYHRLSTETSLEHQLVIAGKKGWAYKGIFDMVGSLDQRTQEKIIFTGYVPEDDLPSLYNAADLFVYPSLYEGFGIPPLEAMACGIPVIASNISSIPEVVGDAGILVDPRDTQAIFEAMQEVLKNRELRAELKRKGIQAAKTFSREKMAQEILAVYKKAIAHDYHYEK